MLANLTNYTVIPQSTKQVEKLSFFYAPYSGIYNIRKHMDFADAPDEHIPKWEKICNIVDSVKPDVLKFIKHTLCTYTEPGRSMSSAMKKKKIQSIKDEILERKKMQNTDLQNVNEC